VSDLAGLNRAAVRRAFGAAAGSYDEVAVLHREILKRMLERLDYIRLEPAVIVDAGCGTGYGIAELERRYRRARLLAVDFALPMLAQVRRQLGWRSRTRPLAADLERLPLANASVDLLFSNLALQWCDPDVAFTEFRRVLRPGGLLMFTTFGPDTLSELRAAWAAADDVPHVHAFADMHDIGDGLLRAGFADPVMDVERHLLTYNEVSGVLRDLRLLGASNALRQRRGSLTGRRRYERFRNAYEAWRDADGRLPATYEVVYGHAWAPPTGSGARATVAVDSIQDLR
jgi:malonyl-CoA O-methyltransferase